MAHQATRRSRRVKGQSPEVKPSDVIDNSNQSIASKKPRPKAKTAQSPHNGVDSATSPRMAAGKKPAGRKPAGKSPALRPKPTHLSNDDRAGASTSPGARSAAKRKAGDDNGAISPASKKSKITTGSFLPATAVNQERASSLVRHPSKRAVRGNKGPARLLQRTIQRPAPSEVHRQSRPLKTGVKNRAAPSKGGLRHSSVAIGDLADDEGTPKKRVSWPDGKDAGPQPPAPSGPLQGGPEEARDLYIPPEDQLDQREHNRGHDAIPPLRFSPPSIPGAPAPAVGPVSMPRSQGVMARFRDLIGVWPTQSATNVPPPPPPPTCAPPVRGRVDGTGLVIPNAQRANPRPGRKAELFKTSGRLRAGSSEIETRGTSKDAKEWGTVLVHKDADALLGRGGYASVWKATFSKDPDKRMRLAAKETTVKDPYAPLANGNPPDEQRVKEVEAGNRDRIAAAKREIKVMARAAHGNIVDYVFHCLYGDSVIFVMEQMDGSLAELVQDGHSVPALPYRDGDSIQAWAPRSQRLWDAWCDTLKALNYVHGRGLVHRDIKFDNILYYARSPNDPRIVFKLADFGIAEEIGQPVDSAGTQWFQAPELLRDPGDRGVEDSRIRPSQDMWALYLAFACCFDQPATSYYSAWNKMDPMKDVETRPGADRGGNYAHPSLHWWLWEDFPRDFLHMHPWTAMGHADPEERMTAAEALALLDDNCWGPHVPFWVRDLFPASQTLQEMETQLEHFQAMNPNGYVAQAKLIQVQKERGRGGA